MPRRVLLKVNDQAVAGAPNNPLGVPATDGAESSLLTSKEQNLVQSGQQTTAVNTGSEAATLTPSKEQGVFQTGQQAGLLGEKLDGGVLGQAVTGSIVARPKSFKIDKFEGIVTKSIPGLVAPTDFRGWFNTKLGAYTSHLGLSTTSYPAYAGSFYRTIRTDRTTVIVRRILSTNWRLEMFSKDYLSATTNTFSTGPSIMLFPGQGIFYRDMYIGTKQYITKYGNNPTTGTPNAVLASGGSLAADGYNVYWFVTGPNGEVLNNGSITLNASANQKIDCTYIPPSDTSYVAHFVVSHIGRFYYAGQAPTSVTSLSNLREITNSSIFETHNAPFGFYGFAYQMSAAFPGRTACLYNGRFFVGDVPKRHWNANTSNLRWTEPGLLFIMEADNFALVGDEPINYLAPTPGGLYIFTSNEAYIAQGSFSPALDDTRIEKLPIPIGADNTFGAVEGSTVYVIYKGNVWKINGGDAEMISAPLDVSFTALALDKTRRLLYAVTTGGSAVYVYSLDIQKWSQMNAIEFTVRDVQVFEYNTDATVRFIGETQYAEYSATNTNLFIKYENLDMGEPTTVKAFERIIFRTQNANTPTVTGSIDGTSTTFAVTALPNGYYEARVTGTKRTGYVLTFDATFAPTNTSQPAVLYPPIEIHYTSREAIR